MIKKVSFEEFVEELKKKGIREVNIFVKKTYNPRRTRETIRLLAIGSFNGTEIRYTAYKTSASIVRADFVGKKIMEELNEKRDELVERLREEGFEVVEGVA